MPARSEHWEAVYAAREETALTWFENEPELSLELAKKYAGPGNAVIDIGGGMSRLVDNLVKEGLGPVTVLDISATALDLARERMGDAAGRVDWITADVTTWQPHRQFSVWHDRAVFHFLTNTEDQAAYVATMDQALMPGGKAIIATFDKDGPEKCSGLTVARYAPDQLAATLDSLAPGRFRALENRRHTHLTPKGNEQKFQVSVFEKR